MTKDTSKAPLYPKSHILAASGIAALLSLALLVFPSREVEAKKTHLSLDGETSQQFLEHQDDLSLVIPGQDDASLAPFATLDAPEQPDPAASADAPPEAAALDEPGEEAAMSDVEATDARHRMVTVVRGDTLSAIFAEVGLTPETLHAVLSSSKEAASLGRLHAGQVLEFELDEQGNLERLFSQLNDLEAVAISKSADGYLYKKEISKPEVRNSYARGVIDSSLFLSAKHAGLPLELTMALADIFGYDIDFAMDLRKGDEFEAIYEAKVLNGKRVGIGNILAARFVNDGKVYTAVRYTNKQGFTGYFTADGMNMRKAFLRMPVDFARISSTFSLGRLHPILNKIRAHKGVDYAAPRGTPIKAAGDGKVVFAGQQGGYGNVVVIQHSGRYRTLYGHMQGFAKGIRDGSSVRQGQIIGFVGTTGLATGPHVHYEFQIDGRQVDPLNAKLPMSDPIAASEKKRFLQLSQPLMARMDEERSTMLALNKQ